MAFSPDGTWVLSGSKDKTIRRWSSIVSGPSSIPFERGEKITALALCAEGRSVYVSKFPDLRSGFSTKDHNLSSEWRDCESGELLPYSPKQSTYCQCQGALSQCVVTWQGPGRNVGVDSDKILAHSIDGRFSYKFSGNMLIQRYDKETGESAYIKIGSKPQRIMVLSRGAYFALTVTETVKISQPPPVDGVESSKTEYYYETFELWELGTQKRVSKWEVATSSSLKELVVTAALSPDGRWAVVSDKFSNIFIKCATGGKNIMQYRLTFSPTIINWSSKDESLIIMAMKDGSVSAWRFDHAKLTLNLRWRSKPWGLQANHCGLVNAHGLNDHQGQVFSQKGAAVQVSAKPSEDYINSDGEEKAGALTQRKDFQPYDPNNINKRRSLFDATRIVDSKYWVVSIVRPKEGDERLHGFLILESVENDFYRVRRIDFFLDKRQQAISNASGNGGCSGDVFGRALIEIANKDLADLPHLVSQCSAKSSTITPAEGLELLNNIHEDQKKKISYCLMGSGSQYRMFRMSETVEHYNCMSWCIRQLEGIKIYNLAERSWIDGIVSYPPWIVPDDKEQNSNQKCLTM